MSIELDEHRDTTHAWLAGLLVALTVVLAAVIAIALGRYDSPDPVAATVPVWSYEAGTVRPIGDRTCHPTGETVDDTPLWTCDWAAQAPPAGWQCVETVERVILCSAHYSAAGLTTVSVKR